MSGVADTSIDAYRKLDIAPSAQMVLNSMRHGEIYTDRQLARLVNRDCSWIPERRDRLMKAGLVEFAGKTKCAHTGESVKTHRLTAKQLELV